MTPGPAPDSASTPGSSTTRACSPTPPATWPASSGEANRPSPKLWPLGHALARLVTGDLAGLFDGPTTVRFDPGLPMLSLDLSRISGSDQLIALVMTCASAWMEAALSDPGAGRRWVIYDEAWRLLRHPA